MAPEVYFSGRKASYTIKSDIWSIGVILHWMLYSVHPFDNNIARYRNEQRIKV
jgi:serine/threonine protein kinase